jgi:hypothetical protein
MQRQDVVADLPEVLLEREVAAALKVKLRRLAKAQALAWNGLSIELQLAYLMAVDRLEGK